MGTRAGGISELGNKRSLRRNCCNLFLLLCRRLIMEALCLY